MMIELRVLEADLTIADTPRVQYQLIICPAWVISGGVCAIVRLAVKSIRRNSANEPYYYHCYF